MLFNSVAFLIFLPAVVLLYYLFPPRYRWLCLLPASYLFYAWWKVEFLFLIVMSTAADFFLSNLIYASPHQKWRKVYLGASISLNLGLLFIFKYLILFVEPMEAMQLNIYSTDHPISGTILYGIFYAIPVGISFYTFQTMSYTLDVYYGRTVPEKHFGQFALFVSFFPQLVAGPIERFNHLMPQLKENCKPLYENFSNGFRLMLYGFFIKVCIADNLAPLVNSIYEDGSQYNAVSNWLGTLGFGYQIYADFAGYSLIAQGAALLLGIRLMDNFKTPYWSTGISEFWQRWHISLSTWFRDYLYIPLGGNQVQKARWVLNIMLVFVISGFWHGANWTFVVWGAIHGLLYLIERFVFKRTTSQAPTSILKRIALGLFTFLGVQFAWIFFRIDQLGDFTGHLGQLFQSAGTESLQVAWWFWLMFALFMASEIWLYNTRFDHALKKHPITVRWAIYLFMIWCLCAWGGVVNHPFIYFQF